MTYNPFASNPDYYFRIPPKTPAVVVHVWRTTTFFDTRKSKLPYESSTMGSSKIRRSVGHTSISIHYGGKYYYQSFGPLPKYKDTELVNPFGSFLSGYNSQPDDIRIFDDAPDKSIMLYDLDFEAMIRFMSNPGKDWNTYNLYRRNCSTYVLKALKIGSNKKNMSFRAKAKVVMGDLVDIFKTGALIPLSSKPQAIRLWTMVQRNSDFLRGVDHLFKYLGGDTPDAVMRYAYFLQQQETLRQI